VLPDFDTPMLPFTVRAVRKSDKENSDELAPIKIIVTISGKRTVKSIGERVLTKDWNEEDALVRKSHPKHTLINGKIKSEISRIEDELRIKQITGERISVRNLKHKEVNFTKYFRQYIDERKGVLAESTIDVFENSLTKLEEYDNDISLQSIDSGWLRRYHQHLTKDLENNTVHKIWKKMRTVFLAAAAEGKVDGDPFKQYQNPKYIQTDRTWLSAEEVESWEKAIKKPMDDEMLRSGMYYLLGCYSGLRISDWQRFNPEFIIDNGKRLTLRAKKNGELVSLLMHAKLKSVVDQLLQMKPCPTDQIVNEKLKDIALLCEPAITKTVTAHSSRHSFAVRCAELGIAPIVTAEFLGITLKAVMVYYKITNRKLDEEMAKWDK
jgi:site-specific recombinase XerD